MNICTLPYGSKYTITIQLCDFLNYYLSIANIGEQSEPSVWKWMENFILPCIPICGIHMYVYMPYVHNSESVRKTLHTQIEKGNGRLGKLAMGVARLVNDEENGCRFKV